MSPKNLSPMIAVLLILGGSISCVLGGSHAIYTLLDLRNPRWLVPVDPSVAQAMAISALRLSGGEWTCGEPGLALTSATALVCCYLARWRSGLDSEPKPFPPP